MQFFKEIKPENPQYPNNGVHPCLWSNQENKLDFSKYFEKLLFDTCIYTGWQETFSVTNKAFISDVAAGNIQKLYEKEFLTNKIILEGLNCCRDIMYNLGYKNFLLENMKTMLSDENTQNVIIIPGCQTEGMLRARVSKAVLLYKYFDKNLTVIASGASPLDNPDGPEKVKNFDESLFIRQELETFISAKEIAKPNHYNELADSKSFDSIRNIRNSFNLLNRNECHNIIIVSSTFHLIRLADAFERELTKYLATENANAKFVKNVFFIGAEVGGEKVDGSFSPAHSGGYVKLMFFDVIYQLLKYKQLDEFRSVLLHNLRGIGYYIIKGGGQEAVNAIVRDIGIVVQEKDIKVEENPLKWATSTNEMPLHTDHSAVDYIIWRCEEPAISGGKSVLSDIRVAYQKLSPLEKQIIEKLHFKNVIKFDGDQPSFPCLTATKKCNNFYFVPWLTQENESKENIEFVANFGEQLQRQAIEFLLEKDDVLIIDNKRMLHGRTVIGNPPVRLLKRYWIKSTLK